MAYKRGQRDHRDMLAYDDAKAKAPEPVYYSKPEWMVEAPVARSNVELPPRPPPYLTDNDPAPSLEAYTSKPAPFSEDGYSAFRRDGNFVSSYKMQPIEEKAKPGQKRNGGSRNTSDRGPSQDEAGLWNFQRRTPIKGPIGDLETEFRSQPGNLINTDAESYAPSTTPPVRSAGSDRTPAKSMYQEQCDQIWSHHRRRYGSAVDGGSVAGKATSNAKYNPFTGAKENSEEDQQRAEIAQQLRGEKLRQRRIDEAEQHPPWATHEGEAGALPLKNG